MALPGVKQTIADGGLGIAQPSDANTQVKMGVCSSGTVNVLYSFTDPTLLRATMGQGPTVESAANTLAIAGGTVRVMRLTGSVAGVLGGVTKVGTGTSVATVAGLPFDSYDAVAVITRAGASLAAGTAAFKYTLDGGDNYSAEIAIPTSGIYAIPDSNITITWGAGTFVVDDTYSFTATAPGYSASDVTAAFVALRADPTPWGFVHLVGAAANGAGSATIAAVVDTQMTAAEAQFRYGFAIMEAADDTDANLKTAFANFVSTRVMVAAGYEELVSAVSGRVYKRSAAWPISTRIAQQDVRRDAARFRGDKEGGALPGVVKLYRDEYATEALDVARFATLRTYPGVPGFFITNGRMMASLSSDFQYVQFRRLMDLACAVNYLAMLEYLNDDALRVDAITGFINEVDARAIEAVVTGKLEAELTNRNRVSSAQVILKRDSNILSTLTLTETVRIVPKGYSKFIDANIGFFNPALQPKVA